MPGVNPPNDNLLPYYLANINNRVRALETQQQLVISNLQGEPVMVTGLQPGSNPPRWGFGLLRKAFKSVAAFFGENETGTVAVWFYGATGAALVKLDETGLHYFTPAGTHSETLFPVASHYHNGTLTTTSTTPVSLPTSPTVTATVGKSGDALVTVSAFIGMTGAYTSSIYLTIDGTTHGQWCAASSSAGGPIGLNSTTVRRLSDIGIALTPGSHTFALAYASSNSANSAKFSAIGLVVQPL